MHAKIRCTAGHRRWNGREIAVRKGLESGSRRVRRWKRIDASRSVTFRWILPASDFGVGTRSSPSLQRHLRSYAGSSKTAGSLVSKEELLRAGWAQTHVSDGVLKVIILEIRRALGDDPAAPSFIETVPRRGYRFIATRVRQAKVPAAVDPSGALVGRDRVLVQLQDRLASALAGQRQLVFLSGEAGIGKTTVRRLSGPRRVRSGCVDCARRLPRALRSRRGRTCQSSKRSGDCCASLGPTESSAFSRPTRPHGWCSCRGWTTGTIARRCAASCSGSPRSGCCVRWRKPSKRSPPRPRLFWCSRICTGVIIRRSICWRCSRGARRWRGYS
jgi:hypothetical protein